MQFHEYPLACAQLARDWFFDKAKRDLLLSYGFTPKSLPRCQASILLVDFESAAEKTGYESARVQFGSTFNKLARYALPDDIGEYRAALEKFSTYGKACDLVDDIQTKPTDVNFIVDKYVSSKTAMKTMVSVKDVLEVTLENNARLVRENKALIEIPTWPVLSKTIGGFNPGRLTMLVAGTGKGKTTLALNLSLAASSAFPVVYFNMEMTTGDLVSKIIMSQSGVSNQQWFTKIEPSFYDKAKKTIRDRHDIFVSDGSLWSPQELAAEIRNRSKLGAYLFIIDYDQKILSSGDDEEWRSILKTVQFVEQVAKQCDVHVIILAQGDDDGDPRASKRSKQSPATVLWLSEDESGYFIEAKKNRFGKTGARIKVRPNLECSQFFEAGEQEWKPIENKVSAFLNRHAIQKKF